jgi:hypothetical protein
MTYLLAIFRNKTDTMAYYSILSSYKVKCNIINTPKQAMIACGISVKLNIKDYDKALQIFKRRRFSSFDGFYKVIENGASFIFVPYLF